MRSVTDGSHYRTRYRDRLTPRQEEILTLISRGSTNAEIADRLGITLDGAKWNVSEIIAKLGVDSREGAVAAWRAEQGFGRRLARGLHALLAPIAVHKLAVAGVAGALVAVGAGGMVIGALRSGAASADEHPPTSTFQCPITIPGEPYIATAPYPRQPPDYYRAVWYGTDALWTMLHPGGEVWGTRTLQKTFWWSRNFRGGLTGEPQPLITVTGKRLDAPGSFSAGNPGTGIAADFGSAMLVAIEVPSTGCWEIRARYKGSELAYVVRVED
jgi:DNA-binding CsgD family transcriptional regulator